ncbi:hypothetical protein MPTK1_6g05890 [Marchantia polymorpha subsp. ruderalis]|uniref:Uncharacterized protein n=1 Tax=Marchantia polymorpha subsp. ruderalis TaxID=1480154 RepID=A0AAF6BNZ8_MARPO|nr:hypothetical protein Mp_6g05890 [Marchantia polymorpha subsp. ruderalis]
MKKGGDKVDSMLSVT